MKKAFSLLPILRNTICAALVLLVLLAAPTGWLYDLRAGEGTGQGQRPSADVQRLQRQEDIETFFLSSTPATVNGGELAACIIADSVVRIIPGAIGDEASALTDSFQDNLLAPPVYTRPAEFRGWRVPDVLLSGNFAEIARWQDEQAYERTLKLRPDLLENEK